MEKETLEFKIGLSGTYWNKTPEYEVLFNGESKAHGQIPVTERDSSNKGEVQYISFLAPATIGTEQTLQIRLLNKEDSDTIENEDKTAIVKDMLLNLESIAIDGLDLEHLMWSKSVFTPDNKQHRKPVAQCVNFGWNGTYELKFTSPFYIWLLTET